MKFLDKNNEELYVGVSVNVPVPTIEDQWNFDFEGQIKTLDRENNYCIVEDGDGDCWAIEPERLELS